MRQILNQLIGVPHFLINFRYAQLHLFVQLSDLLLVRFYLSQAKVQILCQSVHISELLTHQLALRLKDLILKNALYLVIRQLLLLLYQTNLFVELHHVRILSRLRVMKSFQPLAYVEFEKVNFFLVAAELQNLRLECVDLLLCIMTAAFNFFL